MRPREGLGTDQEYLRGSQYKDPTNLNARIALHANYTRADEPWYPWLVGRINWPVGAEVLEVGCGTGALWANVAPLLPDLRLTLTDLSEGMLATAARTVASIANIELAGARTCDVQALPLPDAAFDIAVANHMLYHVPDPRRAAAELARVLRPNGVLLAATNGPRHLDAIAELSRQALGWSPLDFSDRRFGKTNGRPSWPVGSDPSAGTSTRASWCARIQTTSSPSSPRPQQARRPHPNSATPGALGAPAFVVAGVGVAIHARDRRPSR